jgi:16S rRNA (adenine1518-N6/adenine1519-N6)-dimethyltransferase
MAGRALRPNGRRPKRRLGQHFVADPNLLELIVRESGVGSDDGVLEVGGGAGALSERLAPRVGHLHVVEVDERLRPELEAVAGRYANVTLIWADAMKLDLGSLVPSPSKLVSNLPYAIATPLILRTIEELPGMDQWLVMVQREIADRLRARPGTRAYGAPSVLVQLACEIELVRTVDRAVFSPRPRVQSALLRLRRRGPAAPPTVRGLVREAFGHRRKSLARSVGLAAGRRAAEAREGIRAALREVGVGEDARAETLAPEDFVRLDRALAGSGAVEDEDRGAGS